MRRANRIKPAKNFRQRQEIETAKKERAKNFVPRKPRVPAEIEAKVEEFIRTQTRECFEEHRCPLHPKFMYDGLKELMGRKQRTFINWRFRRYNREYKRWLNTRQGQAWLKEMGKETLSEKEKPKPPYEKKYLE